jgi:hypothetical protein
VGPLPRLGLFLVTLAVVFGGSFAVGAALDNGDDPAPEPSTTTAPTTTLTHAAHGGPP